MTLVFKICSAPEWSRALAAGSFEGSAADNAEGFIHLSAAHQLRETLARHFKGRDNLVLVAFDAGELAGLRWESSRGGDLFPHAYASLPAAAALWVQPLPLADGMHVFPENMGG